MRLPDDAVLDICRYVASPDDLVRFAMVNFILFSEIFHRVSMEIDMPPDV